MGKRSWIGWSCGLLMLGWGATLQARQAEGLDRSRTPPALPFLRVDRSGHYLETSTGQPFFWMGDTAWYLLHATTREECTYYLRTRARQGFNVIQTVVLSEGDGLRKPSALGLLPFVDLDPMRPVEAYFDRVVEVVDEAASLGLYVALVPTWGDKLTAPWGDGPRVFRNDNLPVAEAYGRYLGGKLKGRTNLVWLLGGDRPPRLQGMDNEYLQDLGRKAGFAPDQDWTPIWKALAKGLTEGLGAQPLTVFHPQGGKESSSVYLHQESWLSVNGMQSGHGGGHDIPVWEWIARDWAMSPPKPTLDLEPNYEDHPYNPWPVWDPSNGYFRDHDVRKQVYRSVFAGACGVTYGHHAVWGFVGARNPVINHADRDWVDALFRPAARQMVFLRQLMERRPATRIPDPGLILGDAGKAGQHVVAIRDRAGTYALVYIPNADQEVSVQLGKLRSAQVKAAWYDPRTGFVRSLGLLEGGRPHTFQTPPQGPDWVLMLEDPACAYPHP